MSVVYDKIMFSLFLSDFNVCEHENKISDKQLFKLMQKFSSCSKQLFNPC